MWKKTKMKNNSVGMRLITLFTLVTVSAFRNEMWDWECSGSTGSVLCEELTVPNGAVGAVMDPRLTGGELQQFIPLFLPFLFCVHQTGLRRERDDTHSQERKKQNLTGEFSLKSLISMCGSVWVFFSWFFFFWSVHSAKLAFVHKRGRAMAKKTWKAGFSARLGAGRFGIMNIGL